MKKVICVKCGSIGFTAAPKYVRCSKCGGRHKVIAFKKTELAKGVSDDAYNISDSGNVGEKHSG